MKTKLIVVSGLVGAFLGLTPVLFGDTLPPPKCPPSVAGCGSNYGKIGSPVFVCCDDLTDPTKCVNWFKQKWLCNNDPGDPATYGYTLSSNTDTVNMNCDPNNPGACY